MSDSIIMRQNMKQEMIGNFHPSQLKGIYFNHEKQSIKGLLMLLTLFFGLLAFLILLYMVKSSLGINLVEGSPVGEFLDASGICEHFGLCHDTLQLK